MTEEEFRENVATKVATGSSFVGAVYQAMDEATAKEDQSQWACHKGCSACCKQMVMVTSGEIDEIVRYLNSLKPKRRRRIMGRVWERVKKYLGWFENLGGEDNPLFRNQMWTHEQWGIKPCPFLSPSGACSIHPVRPMDCRTMHSRSVCYKKDWKPQDVKRMPYDFEGCANNMVVEHETRVNGSPSVAPIHHWLQSRKRKIKA